MDKMDTRMTRSEVSPGRCQGGFTLLEVMMAMAILTIGILSIVGIQYLIVNGNTSSNVVTQQLHLATQVMEEYKNSINPLNLSPANLNNVDQNGEPGGPYNVTVAVSNPLGGNFSRFITVTVTRTGGVGGHPITIRSMTQGHGI
jgi:type IV pilus assembly protein PilV